MLFILLLGYQFAAASVQCSSPISQNEFEQAVKEVQEQYFPEIPHEVKVKTFTSDDYFLQARPSLTSLIRKNENRKYFIFLNTKLLDCPPPPEALEAILVHEFEHILDYTQWSGVKIALHGIKYETNFKNKVYYERATDKKVLEKKLHQGLAAYRLWVYQWLTPQDLAKKKAIYLTPEEILTHP